MGAISMSLLFYNVVVLAVFWDNEFADLSSISLYENLNNFRGIFIAISHTA